MFCGVSNPQSLHQMTVKSAIWATQAKAEGAKKQNLSSWELPPASIVHPNPSSPGASVYFKCSKNHLVSYWEKQRKSG